MPFELVLQGEFGRQRGTDAGLPDSRRGTCREGKGKVCWGSYEEVRRSDWPKQKRGERREGSEMGLP